MRLPASCFMPGHHPNTLPFKVFQIRRDRPAHLPGKIGFVFPLAEGKHPLVIAAAAGPLAHHLPQFGSIQAAEGVFVDDVLHSESIGLFSAHLLRLRFFYNHSFRFASLLCVHVFDLYTSGRFRALDRPQACVIHS